MYIFRISTVLHKRDLELLGRIIIYFEISTSIIRGLSGKFIDSHNLTFFNENKQTKLNMDRDQIIDSYEEISLW